MLKTMQKKIRRFFEAVSPAPREYKTPPERLEDMSHDQEDLPNFTPKGLADFPSGLYENEQGDRIHFEGFVPYGDEMLALYREMYQYEWQLQEAGEFIEEFFKSGGAVNVVPVTAHKRW